MTRTQKYNFIVTKNQFHRAVNKHYEDITEINILDCFEQICLELKTKQKATYSMIELGSNQCYYSLLFKHILGKDKTTNIMVEPVEGNLIVGKEQFSINNCDGKFYHKGIGNNTCLFLGESQLTNVSSITLDEILTDNKLSSVDILHSDIDGSEKILLPENKHLFQTQTFSYIFLMTHSNEIHSYCKNFLIDCNYTILTEYLIGSSGTGLDGVLVFKL